MESQSDQKLDQGQQKRRTILAKCIVYTVIVLFIAISGVLAWFVPSATVIKSPKVRFDSITTANFISNNTSFSMDLITQVSVKNPNLGFFDYRDSKVPILYQGTTVGEAVVKKSSVSGLSTKRFNVTIPISSNGFIITSSLRNDTNRGVLPLESRGTLRGRVITAKLNRKRSGRLSCTMSIDLRVRVVQDLKCK